MDADPALVSIINAISLSNCLSASAAVILVYDYCLTLQLEIDLIWRSKWCYSKVLFLLIRYIPFIDTVIVFLYQSLTDCKLLMFNILLISGPWIMVVNIMLAESILAIRTWAIWRRNRKVGIILGTAVVTSLITLVAFTIFETYFLLGYSGRFPFFQPTGTQSYDSIFRSVYSGRNFWEQYITLGLLQFFVLAPLVISAFKAYRSENSNELSNIVYRDGILCYIFLFCTTMVYAIIQYKGLLVISIPTSQHLEVVMYSVLTGRVVLNIRQWANRHQIIGPDLHTMYHDMDIAPKETTTLRFAPHLERSEDFDSGAESRSGEV